MDEIDEAIVELLEVDGRLTHREIARTVGLSSGRQRHASSASSPAVR